MRGFVLPLLLSVMSLALAGCYQNPLGEGAISEEELNAHLTHQNYKNMTRPGLGVGLGRIVGPPTKDWEQACLASGVCVNVATTTGKIQIAGGLGCHKERRLAYVVRQVALQLQVAGEPQPFISLLLKASDYGNAMGVAMAKKIEPCAAKRGCNAGDKVADMKKGPFKDFLVTRHEIESYLQDHPETLRKYPDVQKLLDYELDQLESTVRNIKAVKQNGKWVLINPASKRMQTAWEVCNAVDPKHCRIQLPKKPPKAN